MTDKVAEGTDPIDGNRVALIVDQETLMDVATMLVAAIRAHAIVTAKVPDAVENRFDHAMATFLGGDDETEEPAEEPF